MENNAQNLEFEEALAAATPKNYMELVFMTSVASPVYTGKKITGEVDGNGENKPINIMLVDRNTRQQITNGWAASLKVKIVLIHADFGDVNGNVGIWTPLEFKNNIIVNFEKKKNLFLGDLSLVLKDGSGTLGEIRIKHDRNPIPNVRLRLGAMVDGDYFPYAIKEAITYPFDVKDRRNEAKNKGPLALNDKVWQLVNISKYGRIHKRLESKNVGTVRDFLDMFNSNPQALKEIYGIKGKKWEMTLSHAKTSLTNNVAQQVGSTSQQSDHITSFDYHENINLGCYKPHPYEKDSLGNMLVEDCNFSIQDVELGGVFFYGLEPYEDHQQKGTDGVSTTDGLARKRWMKLRATLWFSMVTFSCDRVGRVFP